MLCTTRFDPSLEAFHWNNAPDGTPSPYLLLPFQLDRLLSSRWPVLRTLDYAALESLCDSAARGAAAKTPLKIRLVFHPSGDVSATATPLQPLRYDPTEASLFQPDVDAHSPFDPILEICMDTQPTTGTCSMKTTDRRAYDDARTRVGIPPPGLPHVASNHSDDVILFSPSGAIMESSICNVAFYRHGCWLTPPLTVGCISGVFRRWLLENGRIREADVDSISLDTVQNNEWVLVFNGVMGCQLGRVRRDGTRRD